MTARELRQMLTAIDNQKMTAKELRAILFEIDDQDKEMNESELFELTLNTRGE